MDENERHVLTVAMNIGGPTRRETVMGREFVVVPATTVRDDLVLANNLGRCLFPAGSVTPEFAETANGAPVLLDHPTVRGAPVTGRNPDIMNAMGVGFLYRARADAGRLRADVYLAADRAADLPELASIIDRAERGEPVEGSTGFPVMVARQAGKLRGEDYDLVIAPAGGLDHYAVFANAIGACSVAAGCGLAVNRCCVHPIDGGTDETATGGNDAMNEDATDTMPAPDPTTAETVVADGPWRNFIRAAARFLGLAPATNESDEEKRAAIHDALLNTYGADDRHVFLSAVYSDEGDVVFEVDAADPTVAGMFRTTFAVGDDGTVTLGEPVAVRRVTTFEPVTNVADDNNPETQGESMNRDEMIRQLVANGRNADAMNALSDCDLRVLVGATAGSATNGAPEGGDTAAWRRAHEYRAELETLRAQTANALAREAEERAALLDDVLFAGNSAYEDAEVHAMDIVQLRKLHKTMFPEPANYAGRGGIRTPASGGGDFGFVGNILGGTNSVLTPGKGAN